MPGVVDQALKELVEQVDIKIPDPGADKVHSYTRPGRPEKSMTTRESASSSGT